MQVTKKSGNLQKFSKTKIYRSCRKAGTGVKDAQWVTKKVSKHLYDKISTRKIGEMVTSSLRKVDRHAADTFNRIFARNWKGL
jgi:transcriptional regulator NrdR family protein